jgi:hypothetical protein
MGLRLPYGFVVFLTAAITPVAFASHGGTVPGPAGAGAGSVVIAILLSMFEI